MAQQLLDALLLPPITLQPEAVRIEHSLNRLQTKAAKHQGRAYLLEAGPGTRKTQTLTTRVEGLLSDGVDPGRILLLIFSNKAAGEMADRIALKNKLEQAFPRLDLVHYRNLYDPDSEYRKHSDGHFACQG